MTECNNSHSERDSHIVFIIPLKAKAISKDWDLTCYLLEKTICSILRQEDNRFEIRLVCHDIPDLPVNIKSHIIFLEANYPPLTMSSTRAERGTDKLCKHAIGLKSLADLKFSHYMFVDADDLIANDLSYLAFSDYESHIQVFEIGYVFDEKSKYLWRVNGFSHMCGTCAIFRHDHDLMRQIPSEIDINSVFENPRIFYQKGIYSLGRHNDWERKAADFGKNVSHIAEPYTLYRWDYGDQTRSSFQISTSKSIRKHLPQSFSSGKRWQPEKITGAIRQRFSIF